MGGYYKGMTYRVGTSFKFSADPEPEKNNQEWDIGTAVLFANFEDDVRIFTPKFKFSGVV